MGLNAGAVVPSSQLEAGTVMSGLVSSLRETTEPTTAPTSTDMMLQSEACNAYSAKLLLLQIARKVTTDST